MSSQRGEAASGRLWVVDGQMTRQSSIHARIDTAKQGGCKKLTELHSDPDFESGLSITQPYVYASRHSTSNRHAHTSACTLRRLCHEPARVIRQQASPHRITGVEDNSGLFSSGAIHSQHHHIGKPKLTHT